MFVCGEMEKSILMSVFSSLTPNLLCGFENAMENVGKSIPNQVGSQYQLKL
jgi:hypothetical protein